MNPQLRRNFLMSNLLWVLNSQCQRRTISAHISALAQLTNVVLLVGLFSDVVFAQALYDCRCTCCGRLCASHNGLCHVLTSTTSIRSMSRVVGGRVLLPFDTLHMYLEMYCR